MRTFEDLEKFLEEFLKKNAEDFDLRNEYFVLFLKEFIDQFWQKSIEIILRPRFLEESVEKI